MLSFTQFLHLFLFLLIGTPLLSQTRDYVESAYNIEDGLVYNDVVGILKDKHGYMWFGTKYGMSRFNGIDFKNFTHQPGDSTSLSGTIITAIAMDNDQEIWISGSGLCKYNYETQDFTQYFNEGMGNHQQENWNYFRSMAIDSLNRIWLSTKGSLVVFDPAVSTFQTIEIKIKGVFNIFFDRDGFLWLASSKGLKKYKVSTSGDNKIKAALEHGISCTELNPQVKSLRIHHLLHDSKRNLWIGTERGLYVLPEGEEVRRFHLLTPSSGRENWKMHVNQTEEDAQGRIWALVGKELMVFDPGSGEVLNRQRIYQPESGKFWLDNLYLGDDSIAWVGTKLGVFKLRKQLFHYYGRWNGQDTLLSDWNVNAIREDRHGNLLVATRSGINLFNPSLDKIRTLYPDPDPVGQWTRNNVSVIECLPDGRVWLGSYSRGISLWDPEANQFHFPKPKQQRGIAIFSGSQTTSLLFKDSLLWFGNSRGWGAYDIHKDTVLVPRRIQNSPSEHGNKVHFIEQDPDEDQILWIGYESSLLKYNWVKDSVELENSPYPERGAVKYYTKVLCFSGETDIFIGTRGGGLCKFNRTKGEFTQLFTHNQNDPNSLPNNNVEGLEVDDSGNLWISTDKGISILEVSRGSFGREIFTNYEAADGLAFEEFHAKASCKTQEGKLFFGGERGFIWFHPARVISYPENSDSDILITNVTVNGKQKQLIERENESPLLILDPDEDYFEISFAIYDYRSPDKRSYKYRLVGDGRKGEWNIAQNQAKTARYTDIPPGDYRLEIMAKGPKEANKVKIIEIKAKPHTMETTWFQSLMLVLSISLISGIIYSVQKQKRQKQQMLTSEREAILQALRSQMNPHFIFNSLNSVNNYIAKNDHEKANQYLVDFSKLMRRIMENSRQPFISLEEELDTLMLYLNLEHLRQKDQFDFSIDLDPDLDPSKTKFPPMLIQPFVENAIWHGLQHKTGKGHLTLRFMRHSKRIVCEIEDDGIGRKKAEEIYRRSSLRNKSTGMQNVLNRIDTINSINHSNIEATVIDLVRNGGEALGTKVVISMNLMHIQINS